MLVAYGPDGRPAIAEETPQTQLQSWSRERLLYCPNCRGIVHVRGGAEKRTQLHFAHQKGECAWSTEGESVRHMRGKVVLAEWLRDQFPSATVTLEERLPEPNRIADIFVAHTNGTRQAIEFQCAPLDIEEWRHRHDAYRKAGIIDTWIIGTNRREKQEAFIEAILTMAREVLFLDPQVTPPRTWLRWPINRTLAQKWQGNGQHKGSAVPTLAGWVGRLGYGATLIGALSEARIDEQGHILHPRRATIEARIQLLQSMSTASVPDESTLATYLRQTVDEQTLHSIILPLLRSYLLDPELLRRYNYGRGQVDQPLNAEDIQRVRKARAWLATLTQRGISITKLQEITREIPFVGPYAAFAGYIEMLIALHGSPIST
ncbi:MAG TPA: competence protein CoiA family protein [Ktedonobacteraceae bacterium]|nr:competence protein CoiA family protein [Ktedonobacteraceae bacterium]